jgi:tetratricopeptide (TPR) repeat protein
MKRAAIFCVAFAIGMVFVYAAPVWGRGFGGGRGGGGGGFRGGGYEGGGFGRLPVPTYYGPGYFAPIQEAPRETYHAPAYNPGPVARYESHVESYRPASTVRANIARRADIVRGSEGVGRAPLAAGTHLNENHVANNHWDRWHGHGWDGGWYHGSWHGHWDNYWHAGWSNWWANPWYARTAFWGVTGWWLGAAVYDSGYLPYYNPYYVQSYTFGPTVINYEQPVQTVDYGEELPDGNNPPPVSPAATQHADAARQAFYDHNYRLALNEIQRAIGEMPGDPAFHEMRALILFAMGEYRAAAAAIHSLLAVGPGWDWTTMIGLYPSEDVYTKQLRALEIFRRDHPNDAAARFLLAYHYLTMGHTAAAANELRAVVQLVPRDQVAAQLLSMITSSPNQAGQGGSPPPAPEEPNPKAEANAPANGPPIDQASLMGTWTARREDGSSIQLTLTPDAKFTWRYSQGEKSHAFSGTSTVSNNLLVLQQANGESMVGRIVPSEGRGFHFYLVGGPPNDSGLNFTP